MTRDDILPVPRQVRDNIDSVLRGLDSRSPDDQRWRIRRLVERTYAAGYTDGYDAGMSDTYADHRAEIEREKAALEAAGEGEK